MLRLGFRVSVRVSVRGSVLVLGFDPMAASMHAIAMLCGGVVWHDGVVLRDGVVCHDGVLWRDGVVCPMAG